MRIAVTGAGGFIGSHLVKRLKAEGHWVRGIDIKRPEWEPSAADEWREADLRQYNRCILALDNVDQVYALAADMGGIGHITAHHAEIATGNVQININTLEIARQSRIGRLLYTSSACVYPTTVQAKTSAPNLTEDMAWPAQPEEGYGLEKLYSEKLCEYYRKDYGLDTCVVRLHNVYGPFGTWEGGREKAPAAACRKIAESECVTIWGDGEQTRSFMYVDDCVEGLVRLMASGTTGPVNLGTEELVSINQLFNLTAQVADVECVIDHELNAPQGVRGRNSDNTLLRLILDGWEPRTTLAEGLAKTYPWVKSQVDKRAK